MVTTGQILMTLVIPWLFLHQIHFCSFEWNVSATKRWICNPHHSKYIVFVSRVSGKSVPWRHGAELCVCLLHFGSLLSIYHSLSGPLPVWSLSLMPAVFSKDQSRGWQTNGAVVVDGDDAAVPLSTSLIHYPWPLIKLPNTNTRINIHT